MSYIYDENGWLQEIKGELHSKGQTTEKVLRSYTYDTFGRLVKTVTTDYKKNDQTKTITYTYDNVGNRLKEDDGTTTISYTYNGLDQLKTSTKEKGTAVEEVRQYDYDMNGNQTDVKNTKTGENQTYVYDAENRLSQVSMTKDRKTAVIQQNSYNGEGQRIQKVDVDETINYYYQDGVVAYTTDANGKQNSQNLIGTDGNVLATERFQQNATQYYLYNKDIQGSTSSLVKEDGSADATYQYTDFGETTIQGDDQAKNEVSYTGGIYDQSTGLYYLNARYYNPEDGRFLTEDTYHGENDKPDTQHLYVYCANNPVNYVDPSGHLFFSAGVEITLSCIATYVNTTQLTVDTHGNFTVENSRSYGVKIAWPKYSVAGFFMVGSGYIDGRKKQRKFDIGADVEIGAFSFVGGLSITNGSASAYFSGAYSSQKYSRAKGYLNILKTKEVSPHAYVICGNNIGKISISSFLKKRKNYKVVKYAKKEKVTIMNKKKYVQVAFKGKKFEIRNNSIRIAK